MSLMMIEHNGVLIPSDVYIQMKMKLEVAQAKAEGRAIPEAANKEEEVKTGA